MARKQRIHYPGAIYHIITRGNNKEYIFNKAAEKSDYIEIIKQYKKKYAFNLYAYCIMDNHAHLLIEVDNFPINKIMQGIQQVFTQRYNKKFERTGHVFEQRYKAKLCKDDGYLLQLIRYIHQNPVRADITEGLSYKWSSHQEYVGETDITDIDFPLSIFSKNKKDAISQYLVFINELKEEDYLNQWEKVNKNEKEDIDSKHEKENSLVVAESIKFNPQEIIDVITKISEYRFETIYGTEKNREISDLRKILIIMLKLHTDLSRGQIANIMGIGLSAVSNITNKRFNESRYFREMKAKTEIELCNCEA